jgi:DNA-binding protein YbaB
MPREIDDAWIEEAIAAYRRIEEKQASFAQALSRLEVAVRSPDESVEVIVGADGAVRRVTVLGSLQTMSNAELSRSIQQATSAAHEAAEWARRKLYDETFGDYDSLRSSSI